MIDFNRLYRLAPNRQQAIVLTTDDPTHGMHWYGLTLVSVHTDFLLARHPNLVKIHVALTLKRMIQSGHNFTHVRTAELSWHVQIHDDVIKWKHFPRYWPFVRGIHRSPVNSLHKGQWRGALIFSLMCVWINVWVNNCEASDVRRYCAHYDVTVMMWPDWIIRNKMGSFEIKAKKIYHNLSVMSSFVK